ncbi:MAG: SctF chaperone SctG [Waddliaceae bacterium]|jgi:hypothetical protein|nr:SctF chaperone SctG [Waddliaceae bacterium]MBT3578458.1 SctF chaperone SctG [Waddliaceae bacterium]MBT4445083.1 SctF chaperone SctG [Waddliaceae bacterium]MBT6927896.1 SctF chaperone SctG [Waddliaceae bacterium]MBT7264828.1 SctF chaperone SctG [Waddliaceae bacterium]
MSSENTMTPYQEDFGNMIEAGFIAVKNLDEGAAHRLFHAANILKPESTAPMIGIGYIYLNKLQHKEAADLFEQVIDKEPDNDLATMFLGLSYVLSDDKQGEGEKLIKTTMKKTEDPAIQNLGKVALEWNEKDLKSENKKKFIL